MAWVYIDDQFPDHPKVAAAGDGGGWMFVCGLAYCRRYNTAGRIPKGQVPKLTTLRSPLRVAAKLATAPAGYDHGLWEDRGDHYHVHDYDHWNKPQESRSAAGRKAAQARWAKGAKRNANAYADASESQSEPACEDDAYPDASGCPYPYPYPSVENKPPLQLTSARDPSAGEGSIIDQAIQLASERYVQHEQDRGGKVDNPSGLAGWWRQTNETGARERASRLLADHNLTATQLADALTSPTDPRWLAAYRRRPDPVPGERPGPDVVEAASALARAAIRQPGATP